jgi:hypothetical protein
MPYHQVVFCLRLGSCEGTMSYYRPCRKCGRRIHLRQMPAGQWVAFEGYDTPHKCNELPKRRSTAPPPPRRAEQAAGGYDDLEFADIRVGDDGTTATAPPSNPSQRDGPSAGYGHGSQAVYSLISHAIQNRRVLRIAYRGRTGANETRDIEPLDQDGVHCRAYCRLRRDFRTFRLDRIQSAQLRPEAFVPKASPDSGRFQDEVSVEASTHPGARGGIGWGWLWVPIGIGLAILWCGQS